MTRWTRHRHRAMATLFEVLLPEEGEGSRSLAEILFDEIDRVENLLSRFDPVSEISRLNRNATKKAVRINAELFVLLAVCREYWTTTDGAFDPAGCFTDRPTHFGHVELDEKERRIAFKHPDLMLDLGGVGKGFALLQCREMLRGNGIQNALIHGGSSSVLAIGEGPLGKGWPVGLRGNEKEEPIHLSNESLSSSAVRDEERKKSDVIDPKRKKRLSASLACTVIGKDPVAVEILSTSFLVMGKGKTETYLEHNKREDVRVIWKPQ